MNELDRKVIELKYADKTYEEISEAVGGQYAVNTLKDYFSIGGKLYDDYAAYKNEMGRQSVEEAKELLKKAAAKAAKAILDVLERNNSGKKEWSKDDQMIVSVANTILDRAGMPVIRKLDFNNVSQGGEMSREEYVKRCRQLGIDPDKLVHQNKAENTEQKQLS